MKALYIPLRRCISQNESQEDKSGGQAGQSIDPQISFNLVWKWLLRCRTTKSFFATLQRVNLKNQVTVILKWIRKYLAIGVKDWCSHGLQLRKILSLLFFKIRISHGVVRKDRYSVTSWKKRKICWDIRCWWVVLGGSTLRWAMKISKQHLVDCTRRADPSPKYEV